MRKRVGEDERCTNPLWGTKESEDGLRSRPSDLVIGKEGTAAKNMIGDENKLNWEMKSKSLWSEFKRSLPLAVAELNVISIFPEFETTFSGGDYKKSNQKNNIYYYY